MPQMSEFAMVYALPATITFKGREYKVAQMSQTMKDELRQILINKAWSVLAQNRARLVNVFESDNILARDIVAGEYDFTSYMMARFLNSREGRVANLMLRVRKNHPDFNQYVAEDIVDNAPELLEVIKEMDDPNSTPGTSPESGADGAGEQSQATRNL